MLHAGDVFHHTRPSWSTLTHFVRQMRRLEWARIPVVVIAGNHDTPRLRTTGSVFGLLAMALPDIRFMTGYDTEEQSFEELGVMVHGVPHGALINPDPPALLHHPTLAKHRRHPWRGPRFRDLGGTRGGRGGPARECARYPLRLRGAGPRPPPRQPGHQCLVQRLDRADVLGGSGRATGIRPGDARRIAAVCQWSILSTCQRGRWRRFPRSTAASGRRGIWRT